MTTKVEIFPIKICARKEENSEELNSVMTITFEPDEESFKQHETAPTVSIKLTVESNKDEDIDYICSLIWFDHFFTHTGVYNLLRRVNFACHIDVSDKVEFTDAMKEKLNAGFGVFVSKLRSIIDDKYIILWAENPIFAITMGSENEETPNPEATTEETPKEETPMEEVKDESVSN